MQNEFEAGALVAHRYRPGVWRVVGTSLGHAAIEPQDDAAAASLQNIEAYTVVARIRSLTRLLPGRSVSPPRPMAAIVAWNGKACPVASH